MKSSMCTGEGWPGGTCSTLLMRVVLSPLHVVPLTPRLPRCVRRAKARLLSSKPPRPPGIAPRCLLRPPRFHNGIESWLALTQTAVNMAVSLQVCREGTRGGGGGVMRALPYKSLHARASRLLLPCGVWWGQT